MFLFGMTIKSIIYEKVDKYIHLYILLMVKNTLLLTIYYY